MPPGAGGRRRKAKDAWPQAKKNLKKDERSEVSSDCVIRNPNKSTSKSRISSNAQCREPKRFLFSALVYPWGGERSRKARNGGRRPKNLGKHDGKNDVLCKEINSGAHLRSPKKP